MNPVDNYILKLQEPYQSIALYLQLLIKKTLPEVEEKYKWSLPFYDYKGKYMCYINFRKKYNAIDLGFVQGYKHQKNLDLLIAGEGRTQVRSVRIKSLEDIDEKKLIEIIIEATKFQ